MYTYQLACKATIDCFYTLALCLHFFTLREASEEFLRLLAFNALFMSIQCTHEVDSLKEGNITNRTSYFVCIVLQTLVGLGTHVYTVLAIQEELYIYSSVLFALHMACNGWVVCGMICKRNTTMKLTRKMSDV